MEEAEVVQVEEERRARKRSAHIVAASREMALQHQHPLLMGRPQEVQPEALPKSMHMQRTGRRHRYQSVGNQAVVWRRSWRTDRWSTDLCPCCVTAVRSCLEAAARTLAVCMR